MPARVKASILVMLLCNLSIRCPFNQVESVLLLEMKPDIQSNPVERPPGGCNEGRAWKLPCFSECFLIEHWRQVGNVRGEFTGFLERTLGRSSHLAVVWLRFVLVPHLRGTLAQARISIANCALGCSQLRGQGDASRAQMPPKCLLCEKLRGRPQLTYSELHL